MKSSGVEGANLDAHGQHVNHASKVQHVEKAHRLDQVAKVDKAALNNITAKAFDPVTQKQEVSKSTSMLGSLVENIEKGQVALDKLINGGVNGKNFNNTELLALQAGMYKYSQELDLTSKVVEKATNGLKDTLKTQV